MKKNEEEEWGRRRGPIKTKKWQQDFIPFGFL
jgi:hypothetical protein